MSLISHIAKHYREIHFGGTWTASNLKDNLKDIPWQQATTKVQSFNTILALVYHINYYTAVALNYIETGVLNGSDKVSFDHPPVASKEDWDKVLDKLWSDAEKFSAVIEQLSEEQLLDFFSEEKYGNYYRNISGIIEHSHYHLGQIVILKKIIQQGEEA